MKATPEDVFPCATELANAEYKINKIINELSTSLIKNKYSAEVIANVPVFVLLDFLSRFYAASLVASVSFFDTKASWEHFFENLDANLEILKTQIKKHYFTLKNE